MSTNGPGGDAPDSATGPNAALSASGTYATLEGKAVPGINTKPLFKLMVEKKASTCSSPRTRPSRSRSKARSSRSTNRCCRRRRCALTALALMSPEQREWFLREWELDFAISEPGLGRFRVNVFMQRGYPAVVMRYITADMPKLDVLGLPEVMKDLIMAKRGLVMMVGSTGWVRAPRSRR